MPELTLLDATPQAELVRKRQLEPAELVEAAIARIERLNPQLNAVITPIYERGLEQARGPLPEGPFSGVPYLLKDLGAQVAGVRYTEGSRFLAGFVSRHDQELVLRHRRAGLVAVGKTSTPEFGILPTTEPMLSGPTRNPWNPEHSPGGSSGGSAAAVASGMVPLAHASDGGGSIRIPASCCGLFGLKPTRMRNPTGPGLGDGLAGHSVEHGLTWSVRDSAALLDATAGPDPGAPYFAPPPARPFLREVGADPGRLRIAFTTTAVTGVEVDAECVRAVESTARLCEELGHDVFPFTPAGLDGEELTSAFLVLYTAGVGAAVAAWSAVLGREPASDELEPLTWAMREVAMERGAVDYLLALARLQLMSRQIAAFYSDFDVWLMPVLAEPPVPLGTFDAPPGNPLFPLLRAALYVPFTPFANVTGQPAMSVPLYWTETGLPVGSQFMGRYADEATLIRLAAQLEQARPWAARRPPLALDAVS
ncbi:amidase family protein [Candidatus Nephthysia bennettiae]|uniref:Amidase n=1 Tax=Candidatus Nephthysia bennettiae TaxID=3127016 RepID=A0A934N7E2_9BACT|nr:amidase [Candidatus Dormibacteraeota bacterium]MBJ7612470.1 amidase [Candidatus Dormibacteraeota bacterium]